MKLSLKRPSLAILACLALLFVNCKEAKKEEQPAETPQEVVTITKSDYGTVEGTDQVEEYVLRNQQGMEVAIITYGGIITSLKVPNDDGSLTDVVLGYDSLEQYVDSNPYFGALIGRYGNRIANARFSIDGTDYPLAANNGPNHLHGGEKGFDKVVWEAAERTSGNSASLVLNYLSADMEEGYPGNLDCTVTYTLTDDNSLEIRYVAKTDKPTIVNLTNHSYFNLSGDFSESILEHVVEINADRYLPVDETLIPTGEPSPVEGGPFDFREAKPIGQDIESENQQIEIGGGYDHCWVLNGSGMRFAASAYHPDSGRYMEVHTNEPGVQFYTGNFLDGSLPAKGGGTYGRRSGFCLETQHYPDSPNQEAFPSVRLNPGETYSSMTTFTFSTK